MTATLSPAMDRILRGRRLAELREAAGKSQGQLAKDSKVPQATISRIEAGKQDLKAEHIQAFQPILQCDYEAFFEEPSDADG